MKQFLLIFRNNVQTLEFQPSLQELQEAAREWQNWFGGIAAQNKLVRPLQRWDPRGIVISREKAWTGPYVELKECIGGLMIIQAHDYGDALEIARDCPALLTGGNVEIRMAV